MSFWKKLTIRPSYLWMAGGCFWLIAIFVGMALLAWHESAVGITQPAPQLWPSDSQIQLSDDRYTLVMFAHPRCPCTRASLGELEKIITHCRGAVAPRVVFYKPSGTEKTWDQTDQRITALELPDVTVIRDEDGVEAHRFHVFTSGQTLLYNPAGELLFSGGITYARGHQGDNDGQIAIESLLNNGKPENRETPVFGCPIELPTHPN